VEKRDEVSAMKVRDVMTTDVASVTTDTPLQRLIELMDARDVSGLPVCDGDGRVLGVVTEADIVAKAARGQRCARPRLPKTDRAERSTRLKLNAIVAGELMTTPALVIDESDDLRMAARRLSQYGVKRLPVTSHGTLCGVISRHDVLKAFTRSDEEIKAEIEQELFAHKVIDAAHDVLVAVQDGVVTLRGTVLRRSTAKIIRFHVDRVDGVVKVVDGLLYASDDTIPTDPTLPLTMYEYSS
jgi:CBS domain-containing protein